MYKRQTSLNCTGIDWCRTVGNDFEEVEPTPLVDKLLKTLGVQTRPTLIKSDPDGPTLSVGNSGGEGKGWLSALVCKRLRKME